MQSKLVIVVGLSLAILYPNIGRGEDWGIFNTAVEGSGEDATYKYWVYRTRVDDKNDNKTAARVLYFKEVPSSVPYPWVAIEAWMWRYKSAGGSGKYNRDQHGFGHPQVKKVHLTGIAESVEDNENSDRQRRIRFVLEGTYEFPPAMPKTTKKIRLEGYFHPGSNTTAADTVAHASRVGDRLVARVVKEVEVADSASGRDSLSIETVLRIVELLSKADNKDEARRLIATLIETHLEMYLTDPCDEQADDDVMEEEALAEDPATEDPEPEVPTEP